MFSEQLAHPEFDNQLQQCGWLVQNRDDMNIMAALCLRQRCMTDNLGQRPMDSLRMRNVRW